MSESMFLQRSMLLSELWPDVNHDRYARPLSQVKYIAVHRNSTAVSAVGLVHWFAKNLHSWGRPGYHIVIEAGGTPHQIVPLDMSVPGAYGFNRSALHVCMLGDFRRHKPTVEQLVTLIEVLAKLRATYNIPVERVKGHSELSVRHAVKFCPGKYIDMGTIRKMLEMVDG
jgi:hypothetical protein